ncbi:PD-(D/E)XK motif protein [Acinetobacter faecalis]|uniref:PD-(D/E)XK motif protein n=1 Tax=Acinetobacter faecalis TaxID=2665161 RepID=UPI002A90B58D|nr:PD-(D/E)XK motif protein [Acinetobacter faecalis]MDY6456810.1 PD-(D/E)XK motif protein [Acinetobacter faecalis]
MGLQIDQQQILVAWKALSSTDNHEGWGVFPLYKHRNWSLLASYNLSEHEEAIFLDIKYSQTYESRISLPVAQGFRVQRFNEETRKGFALIRQVDGDLDLFTKIIVDVCNTIIQYQELNENKLVAVFINRINAWLSFMSKGGHELSQEAELGLIGELEMISSLISLNLPISEVLNTWKGPLDGLKDFEIGSGAIETKSTLSNQGFIAKINSLEQLDDSEKSPLFLNGYRFSLGSAGKTLTERINLIREQLNDYPAELTKFNNLLLRNGYLESEKENYTRKFKTEHTYFWWVDEKFPRLVPGNIAVNIRQAKYEIDLTPFINQSMDLSLVLQKLGIGNCGIN